MQVKQNVNAANFLLVSSQAGQSIPSKDELVNSVGFADVLQNTSNQKFTNDVADYSKTKEATSVSTEKELFKDDVDASDSNVSSTKSTDDANSREKVLDSTDAKMDEKDKLQEGYSESGSVDSSQKIDDSEVNQSVDVFESIPEEDLDVILETIGNLLYDVMQQFDLNLEELSAKLEEFGMEISDLLTQDGLKNFFLCMNDSEVSDLIVDEGLNQQLQAFMSQVSDEIATLENMISDMDAFVSDKDIAQMFSELTATREDNSVMPLTMDSNDEVVVTDEPEVILNKEQSPELKDTKQNNHSSDTSDQNAEESLQQSSTQDTITTEQTSTKTTSFENPILQAIQNAMNNVETTIIAEQPVQQTDILRQVVEQVRVNMNQQQTSMELQLYPEHLGRIQIHVVAKEGVMTASIVAETEAAKQAIESGLLNLKEAMEQQDLKVEAIEVMVSTTGFDSRSEQQDSFDDHQTSNSRRKIDLSELGEDIPLEDEAEIEIMKATGSSVSYRA